SPAISPPRDAALRTAHFIAFLEDQPFTMSYWSYRVRHLVLLPLFLSPLLGSGCSAATSHTNKANTAAPASTGAASLSTTTVKPSSTSTVAAGGTGTAVSQATAAAEATIISRPQPGFSGLLMTGVLAIGGAPPPPGSTLFLGLVKSETDEDPRTCIDAERNPVNDVGQFYAQVACTPQRGDQLLYVLIIGRPEERNWHRGVIPVPPDLTDFRIEAE
ncbi:MAG: hypothetical protein ACR2PL_14195, partial [Dehalococcoidia bacterium]